jgi:hypothetical protein
MSINSRVLSSDSSTTVHVSPKGGEDRKNRWLQSLDHEKPVNAAYFSQVDGTRLLTTDQVICHYQYSGSCLMGSQLMLSAV